MNIFKFMGTILKILLGIILVSLIFYFVSNILGFKLNTDWFFWVARSCPQDYKDVDPSLCQIFKDQKTVSLFLYKSF